MERLQGVGYLVSLVTKEGIILGHEYAGYVQQVGVKSQGFEVYQEKQEF